jgi:hypothetical protein
MKSKKTRKNKRGIKVKKGCVSCKYKEIDSKGRRHCTKCSTIEEGYCTKWRMADALRMKENPFGTIKSMEYLHYVRDIRIDEAEKAWHGDTSPARELEDIRKEFNNNINYNF